MTRIHPAIAEHAIKENPALHARIAELEAQVAALSQQAEPDHDCNYSSAGVQGWAGGSRASPAQDEREATLEELVALIEGAHANDKTFAEAIFDAGFRRPAQTEQTAPQPEQSVPEELFDGHAVYQETVLHRRDSGLLVRTSPENVSDTLDAVVRLIKARRAALSAQGTSK